MPNKLSSGLILLVLSILACWGLSRAPAAGQERSLRTFLICYRWLRREQAEAETTWWAEHASFFVCGSTDAHRELLRRKTQSPMIRYLNINNVTRAEPNGQTRGHPDWDALLSWLECEGLDRERMFLHFAEPTVWRLPNMPADRDGSTEDKLLLVSCDGRPISDQAWAGGANLPLPAQPGQELVVGSDERFDTIRLELAQPALNWKGGWEYLTAQGWRALAVHDGTQGLRQAGAIEFTPPRDWVRSTDGLFRVRLQAERAAMPGRLAAARGRDYITWSAQGYHFPAWHPEADRDGDGYLSSAERAAAGLGDEAARFAYEARVPSYWVGRYCLNVTDPQVCRWAGELAKLVLGRITPPYDGVFVDNGWYAVPLDTRQGAGMHEKVDPERWQQGTINCLQAVKAALGSKLLVLNTGNYVRPVYERYLEPCDGWLGEFWIRPSREFLERQLTLVRERDEKGKIGLLHARLDPVAGDADRGMLLALALYYVCAGKHTYLFVGENYGAQPYAENNWFGAMEVDLGAPLGEATRLPTREIVYARQFARGWVLARPLPKYDSKVSDGETVTLPPGSYRRLRADGTLGEVVSGSLFLHNAEGAILLREGVP